MSMKPCVEHTWPQGGIMSNANRTMNNVGGTVSNAYRTLNKVSGVVEIS